MRATVALFLALLLLPATSFAQHCYEPRESDLDKLRTEGGLPSDAQLISACLFQLFEGPIWTEYEFLRPVTDTIQNVSARQKMQCTWTVQARWCEPESGAQLANGNVIALRDGITVQEIVEPVKMLSLMIGNQFIDSIERIKDRREANAYKVLAHPSKTGASFDVYEMSHDCTLERCFWNIQGPISTEMWIQ